MATKIPQNKQWVQLNQGDIFGNLFSTRNIDPTVPGLLKLAQRTGYVGQTNSTNFGNILNILYQNGTYWIITGNRIYTLTGNLATFAIDATANTPTLSDMSDAVSDGRSTLYVSKTARIARNVGGLSWITDFSDTDFDRTAAPHPLEINVTNSNLLAGDGLLLKKMDLVTGVIDTAITLPNSQRIVWIRKGNNVNYIGTLASGAGTGCIYLYDGLATTIGYNREIPLDTPYPLSGALDAKGNLFILTLDGRLQQFNGSGFSTIGELPPVKDWYARGYFGDPSTYIPVRQRGMTVIKDKIYIAISTSLTNGGLNGQFMVPNFQGGVWCFDIPTKSFYHVYAPSNSNTETDFGQSYGTSLASAIAPYYPQIISDGNSTAVTEADLDVGSILLSGGRLNPSTIAGTTLGTIITPTGGTNRGSFVTNKIESAQVTDKNIAVWCKYQGLETDDDVILFKYRITKRKPIALGNGVTWSSSTVFVTNVADATKMATVVEGDEITVLSGNGAGCTAHITDLSESAGVYTVTLDEAIVGVSATNTGHIMIENWIKIQGTITSADTDGYKRISFTTAKASRWVQLKVEMRGEGGVVAIEELTPEGRVHLPY